MPPADAVEYIYYEIETRMTDFGAKDFLHHDHTPLFQRTFITGKKYVVICFMRTLCLEEYIS